MKPVANQAEGVQPFLAIVAAEVGFDLGGGPVETCKRGEVEAVLGSVRLALGLVPVPHLYAYFKSGCKGECGVGRVKRGLRSVVH